MLKGVVRSTRVDTGAPAALFCYRSAMVLICDRQLLSARTAVAGMHTCTPVSGAPGFACALGLTPCHNRQWADTRHDVALFPAPSRACAVRASRRAWRVPASDFIAHYLCQVLACSLPTLSAAQQNHTPSTWPTKEVVSSSVLRLCCSASATVAVQVARATCPCQRYPPTTRTVAQDSGEDFAVAATW